MSVCTLTVGMALQSSLATVHAYTPPAQSMCVCSTEMCQCCNVTQCKHVSSKGCAAFCACCNINTTTVVATCSQRLQDLMTVYCDCVVCAATTVLTSLSQKLTQAYRLSKCALLLSYDRFSSCWKQYQS
jgi:hypothetical protein